MKADRCNNDYLESMRHVGDKEGDELVQVILSPITPEEVETRLNALLRDLGVDGSDDAQPDTGSESPVKPRSVTAAEIRSVRSTILHEAEFHAGTYRVLDCLKVAGAALRAADVAFEYKDHDSADRFRDQAITSIQDAKKDLAMAWEQFEDGSRASWFTPELKRVAYNDLLVVAEYLATAPDLLSAPESAAAQRFAAYPSGFKDYFGPTPAPDWVDEDLLRKASRVWDENALFILLTLFSGSLPYCYLDERGIPMLYETGKLTDTSYISQRLYETGLMLSAVMSQDGIRVDHDLARQRERVAAVAKDPDVAQIKLTHTRHGDPDWRGARGLDASGSSTDPGSGSAEQGVADPESCERFLSGKGVLYAKKVRLLHAAMRQMALHEPALHEPKTGDVGVGSAPEKSLVGNLAKEKWDKANGVPINQEDLAYTLLTFSYVIPTGLATWGRQPNKDDMRAFLHCWKVTGYLMGIDEELLTDDPDEAKKFFDLLVKRLKPNDRRGQASGKDVSTSVKMTWAICSFLNRYLPKPLHGLPAIMIENQVGRKNAKLLLGSERRWRPLTRGFFWVVSTASKIHGMMNRLIYSRIPLVQTFFEGLMRQVGMAFIESWRDPFERKPFMLPAELEGWKLKDGVTKEFESKLQRWRRRLFALLALGLMLLIGGSLTILTGIVLSVLNGGRDQFELALLVGIPLFVLASLFMQIMVSRTAQNRPTMEDDITLVREAT